MVASLGLTATPAFAGASTGDSDRHGGGHAWGLERRDDGTLAVVDLDGTASAATAGTTTAAGTLVTTEADSTVRALGTDPMRSQQWALDAVSFEGAWTTTRGGFVKVAVVDTGVYSAHEDLGATVLPGIDLVDGGDGRTDPNGHGTHVAGIIAAQAGNGRGIAGGAPQVRILPVRVLDGGGSGYSSDVAEGIIWAVDHGARVVNLSLGGTTPSEGTREAIKYAISKRVIVLAAAGNGALSGNLPVYPGAFSEAVAVASIDSNRTRSAFSNYGPYVDLAAPGGGIVSAWNAGPASYASASGTSMATPYAAAAAALVVSTNPDLSTAGIRYRLEHTADDLGAPGRDDQYGAGLIDPRQAVAAAKPVPADYGTAGAGYWVVDANGKVSAFGGARHYGDLAGKPIPGRIVASTATPSGKGYWLAGADGSVYPFGDAHSYGSMAGTPLNGGVVGMAVSPTGKGYLLLGSDGGIFTFGDARFHGSTGNLRLNSPVLDMTMTATGNGYWMVAGDGGIFTFGDARFHGSTGNLRLNSPAASMTAASDGKGYWIVARDGGIFGFDVPFHGSLPGLGLQALPTGVRIRSLPDGRGYYVLGADGAVFTFGSAKFFGAAMGTGAPAVDLTLLPSA